MRIRFRFRVRVRVRVAKSRWRLSYPLEALGEAERVAAHARRRVDHRRRGRDAGQPRDGVGELVRHVLVRHLLRVRV